MRTLKIVCGIAVLLNSLHLAHAVDHFSHQAVRDGLHGLALWGSIALVAVVGVLSFVGGCLLLKRTQ